MNSKRSLTILLTLVLALALLPIQPVHAATFAVTNTNDSGAGSLALGDIEYGVYISEGALDNTVGPNNVIAYNDRVGVRGSPIRSPPSSQSFCLW